jgi:hypothetical protein
VAAGTASDDDLVVLGVAIEAHELHPVQQSLRNRLDHIGRRQEQHVGQVEVDFEIVIAERMVLCRVKDLQQGSCRVSSIVRADLVDLVQQDHRVHRSRLGDRAYDPAGQGADIGTPVTADLRLIAYATKGDPYEIAAQRPSD